MPRKRGLVTGASVGARLGGLIRFEDTIDFLRSFGSGLEIIQCLKQCMIMVLICMHFDLLKVVLKHTL